MFIFPTLIQIGPIVISSLGVLIVLGFFFGSFMIWKRGKEENFEEEKIMDSILWVSLFSFLVSRTWYIIFHWTGAGANFLSWFDFVGKPGFAWTGAVVGGVLALIIFCQKQKWDFFRVGDFSSFGLALALVLVDLGRFLDGSGQFYEPIVLLIVFRLLYYFDRNFRTYAWYKNKRGEAAPGFLFLIFVGIFALLKAIVAFISSRSLYLSEEKVSSIVIFLLAAGTIYFRSGLYSGEAINLKNLVPKIPKWPDVNTKRKYLKPQKHHYKAGMEAK